MAILFLKLTLTPLMIGAASLGARRWGPLVGGWLVSLPLTSGPVALFLALGHGPAFGAAAARASVAGSIAIVAFCVAYARVATVRDWGAAMLAAALAWLLGAAFAERSLGLPLAVLAGLVVAAWAAGMRLMPRRRSAAPDAAQPPWELTLRMASGTAVVVFVTALAPLVGPGVSGLLAMLPVMGTVLALFAHLRQSADSAIGVLQGILAGLLGTVVFLAIVSVALVPLGVPASFAVAVLAITVIQTLTVRALRASTRAAASL